VDAVSGGALLSRFVAGHPRAWFLTHPDVGAVALYECEGWSCRAAWP
jgi:hypothetical protein